MSYYEFEFTDYVVGVNSTLVDEIYFNDNTNELLVDLSDELYVYDNVSKEDFDAFTDAGSKGGHYNTVFKKKHGPAEYIGNIDYLDIEYTKVDRLVKKDFDSTPVTKEFSLADQFLLDDLTVEQVEATKEFSLQAPPAVELTDAYSYVTSKVHFTLDDGDKVYKYVSNKDSLEDAIAEVDEYVSRLGAKGKVVKVVFKFE